MASGIFFEFAVVFFFVLGSHPSLSTCKGASVLPWAQMSVFLRQRQLCKKTQFLGCYQLAGSKIVVNRDCQCKKNEAVGNQQFSQGDPVLCCVWEAPLFSLLMWHFMANGMFFPVRCQPPFCGRFAGLVSNPSLATCKGVMVEVVKAKCHYCSSKLCLSFGPFEHRSLQQSQLCKNHNVGTATS